MKNGWLRIFSTGTRLSDPSYEGKVVVNIKDLQGHIFSYVVQSGNFDESQRAVRGEFRQPAGNMVEFHIPKASVPEGIGNTSPTILKVSPEQVIPD